MNNQDWSERVSKQIKEIKSNDLLKDLFDIAQAFYSECRNEGMTHRQALDCVVLFIKVIKLPK